jgi:hypothetical protein
MRSTTSTWANQDPLKHPLFASLGAFWGQKAKMMTFRRILIGASAFSAH